MRPRLPRFLTGHLTRSVALIFSFLLFSASARAQSVSFVAGRDFQASQSDTSVILIASGDFNNDGKIDLLTITTAQNDYSISILLGNGDGTFQAPSTITSTNRVNCRLRTEAAWGGTARFKDEFSDIRNFRNDGTSHKNE